MSITSANVSKYRVFIALTVTSIFWANTAIALQTNKNLLLSDGEDDSPQIILVDGDSKQLVLQKLDSGAATLLNEEGSICFLSDNDTDDKICFITNKDQPAIMWSGIDTKEPGIQVSNEGKLQYRNAAGTWIDFDTLGSKVITGTNIEDGTIKGVDIGTQSITGAHLQPALGQDGQVLSLAEGKLVWINSGTADIGDGDITSVKLAPDAVNSAKIVDRSIQSSDLALKTITSNHLSPEIGTNGQVLSLDNNGDLAWINSGAADIGDGEITSAKLANDAVTSEKIINDTIVNVDINASAAIAGTKIAPDFGAQLINTTGDISGANITATGDVTVNNGSIILKDKRTTDQDITYEHGIKFEHFYKNKDSGLYFKHNDHTAANKAFVLRVDNQERLHVDHQGKVSIAGDLQVDGKYDGIDSPNKPYNFTINKGRLGIGKYTSDQPLLVKTQYRTGFPAIKVENVDNDAGLYLQAWNNYNIGIGTGRIYDSNKWRSEFIKPTAIRFDQGKIRFYAQSNLGQNEQEVNLSSQDIAEREYLPIERMSIDSDGKVTIKADDQTALEVGGNITATGVINAKGLKLSDADDSNYMALQAPNNVTSDTTLTLPTSAGSAGQVLQTDGTGTLSWASAAADTSLANADQSLTTDRLIELGNKDLTLERVGADQSSGVYTNNIINLHATGLKKDALIGLGATDQYGNTHAFAQIGATQENTKYGSSLYFKTRPSTNTDDPLEERMRIGSDGKVTIKGDLQVDGENITATGDVTVGNAKGLKLSDADGSNYMACLLYTSPSPRDLSTSRMPSSA